MSGRRILITGGAGFIGSHLADHLLASGHGDRLEILQGDVRGPAAVARAVEGASAVFHLAAQVAVTTSLLDPVHDLEVNARGTLSVLEAVRGEDPPPFVLFTSTNEVQGALEDVPSWTPARGTLRSIRGCTAASPRRAASPSTHRTAARRGRRSHTSSTGPAPTAFRCRRGTFSFTIPPAAGAADDATASPC